MDIFPLNCWNLCSNSCKPFFWAGTTNTCTFLTKYEKIGKPLIVSISRCLIIGLPFLKKEWGMRPYKYLSALSFKYSRSAQNVFEIVILKTIIILLIDFWFCLSSKLNTIYFLSLFIPYFMLVTLMWWVLTSLQ